LNFLFFAGDVESIYKATSTAVQLMDGKEATSTAVQLMDKFLSQVN